MSVRTYLLAAGAFAVGTSAFVVSGVLPAVSGELGVSLTAAGQLATAFAIAYAIGAPLLSTLTGRWSMTILRRRSARVEPSAHFSITFLRPGTCPVELACWRSQARMWSSGTGLVGTVAWWLSWPVSCPGCMREPEEVSVGPGTWLAGLESPGVLGAGTTCASLGWCPFVPASQAAGTCPVGAVGSAGKLPVGCVLWVSVSCPASCVCRARSSLEVSACTGRGAGWASSGTCPVDSAGRANVAVV
jgi:MFS family permease